MKDRAEKIIISIFTLLIFALIFLHFKFVVPLYRTASINTAKELTLEEKLEDFEYMYNVLRENHPYFEVKKRTLGYDWLSDKELFEKWIEESTDDIDFYNTLDVILTSIQNGHTHLLFPDEIDEYKRVFSGSEDEWERVLNEKKVIERYKIWKEQDKNHIYNYNSQESLYAIPVVFKYVEGFYAADEEKSGVPFSEINIEKGSTLLEINSMTPDKYVLKQLDYEELSYDYKRKKYKLNELRIWSRKDSKVSLKLKTPGGKIIESNLEVVPYMELPFYESEEATEGTILEKEKTAYLRVPSFDYLQIDKDREKIYDFLKDIKDYPYLIIDIRGNSGGSDIYWKDNIVEPLISHNINLDFNFAFRKGGLLKPFIKYISEGQGDLKDISTLGDNKNYPPELKTDFGNYVNLSMNLEPNRSIGFKGKIFLLTDDMVYSSAESFAAFAKNSGWATLIGTPTGGDGICYDPGLFELPNSGLVVRFPVGMGLNPDGTANEEYHTQPDIYIEESYNDFLNNMDKSREKKIDPVLSKALELTK